jgi:hypothetical protein
MILAKVISFIENNPNWPSVDKLKEAAESYIDNSTNKKNSRLV